MRYFHLLLILCLLPVQRAHSLEFFADLLYWRATEPVDWVLETNRLPVDQYVTYRTIEFDFEPGFRIGADNEGDWDTKFYYTRFSTSTSDEAFGNLTAAFLGGKEVQPPAPDLYFDTGQIDTTIDYHMFDWDLGKRFYPAEALAMRPIVGLRGGWIDQSFNSAFQAEYPGLLGTVQQSVTEEMRNNFWGIGPKVGIENALCRWRGDECELNCVANFYTAYLLGHWTVSDVTNVSTTEIGFTDTSTKIIRVRSRDFGALTFQAILGLNLKFGRWSATVGYEINDWLNQCQIFDDATGPHNNDLILQGLTANASCRF